MNHEEYSTVTHVVNFFVLAFEGKGKTLRAVREILLARIASSL